MSDSEILIIGANGQLGTALQQLYPDARTTTSDQLDITNHQAVTDFDWSGLKVVINAAAYTNVDGAETPEGRIAAWKVNASAVANLTAVAIAHDIVLIHLSSDYVFDGTQTPHLETEDFSPLGVYAQTKAAGDIAASLAPKHYVLRTSWVIGQGKNFVLTIKSLAEQGVTPNVVNDQIGRLTFTIDLANAIAHLLTTNAPYGTYNLTNDGDSVSWADIAADVYETVGHNRSEVTGISTEQYYSGKTGIAPRPLQSTLSLDKIKSTGFSPRNWRDALAEYLNN